MPAPRRPDVKILLEGKALEQVHSIVDSLMLTDDQVKRVMNTLHMELVNGLSRDEAKRKATSLQMECTYVRSLLEGNENGEFLALDLGGTNFRVLLVRLKDGKCESCSRKFKIPKPKLFGPAKGVFDHLAECVHTFLKEQNMLNKKLPLGFTFSFPMIQESINKGILITWTKSFKCTDGEGQDAAHLLETAIHERGDIAIDVVAVLNDTTGTLMAGSYLDKSCGVGLIMGTGCNAAYLEDLDNVDKWDGPKDEPKHVVIDIEWGAFGDNGSLDFTKTEFDSLIDGHSNHVGSFTFEKLFAGHYVGDIARLVLLKLANENLIFGGHVSEQLQQWGIINGGHISNVERDTDDSRKNTTEMLRELGVENYASLADMSVVRYVCAAVSIRGAQFISASISGLFNHMKWNKNVVAIDGSYYKFHPKLHDMMMAWMAELAPSTEGNLILAEDGSGRGAAFVAAVAVKSRISNGF